MFAFFMLVGGESRRTEGKVSIVVLPNVFLEPVS